MGTLLNEIVAVARIITALQQRICLANGVITLRTPVYSIKLMKWYREISFPTETI